MPKLDHPVRVAVLIPSTDTGVELELSAALHGRASIHAIRVELESVTTAGLRRMQDDLLRQAAVAVRFRAELTVLACTSGSFIGGQAREQLLIDQLIAITGTPIITAASALVAAIDRRGKRIRLGASYTPDILAAEVDYLTAAGLQVVSARSLSIEDDTVTATMGPAALIDLVRAEVHAQPADVAVLSCTNLRTVAHRDAIEAAVGLPLVSSNIALIEAISASAGTLR